MAIDGASPTAYVARLRVFALGAGNAFGISPVIARRGKFRFSNSLRASESVANRDLAFGQGPLVVTGGPSDA